MKKLFTILSVASMMLTTAFSFTSCQKDDLPTENNSLASSSSNDTQKTSETKYYGYQVFLNDEALKYTDIVVTAEYDGKTDTYKVSNGQSTMLNAKKYDESTDKTFSGKLLNVPAIKSKTPVKFTVSTVPTNYASTETSVDVMLAYGYASNTSSDLQLDIINGSSEAKKLDVHTNGYTNIGLMTSKLEDYLAKRASSMCHDFSK